MTLDDDVRRWSARGRRSFPPPSPLIPLALLALLVGCAAATTATVALDVDPDVGPRVDDDLGRVDVVAVVVAAPPPSSSSSSSIVPSPVGRVGGGLHWKDLGASLIDGGHGGDGGKCPPRRDDIIIATTTTDAPDDPYYCPVDASSTWLLRPSSGCVMDGCLCGILGPRYGARALSLGRVGGLVVDDWDSCRAIVCIAFDGEPLTNERRTNLHPCIILSHPLPPHSSTLACLTMV
jgi:hypothetical protein